MLSLVFVMMSGLSKIPLAKAPDFIYNFLGDSMKIKDGFVLKNIGGSDVAVPVRRNAVDMNAIIKLTGTGAFLWRLLETGATREDLLCAMTAEYDVDDATAMADIDAFVARLREADVLE